MTETRDDESCFRNYDAERAKAAGEYNPYYGMWGYMGVTEAELALIEALRNREIRHIFDDPEYLEDSLGSGGCTPEDIERFKRQYLVTWNEIMEDLAAVFGVGPASSGFSGPPALAPFVRFVQTLQAGGSFESVCRSLGLSRAQYDRYERAWMSVQAAYEELAV